MIHRHEQFLDSLPQPLEPEPDETWVFRDTETARMMIEILRDNPDLHPAAATLPERAFIVDHVGTWQSVVRFKAPGGPATLELPTQQFVMIYELHRSSRWETLTRPPA